MKIHTLPILYAFMIVAAWFAKAKARKMSSPPEEVTSLPPPRVVRLQLPDKHVRDVADEKTKCEECNRTDGVIFGKKYCLPDEKVFEFYQQRLNDDEYILRVLDRKGKMNWKIVMYNPLREDNKFTVHDNGGKIIMTLKDSVLPPEDFCFIRPRFKVYKGDSTAKKDFLFTVRRPRVLWKCDVEVFLPSTKEEEGGFDFEIVASWMTKNFVVKNKKGDVLAQGGRRPGWFVDIRSYKVTVSPNVDYVFMIALTLMFHEMVNGDPNSRMLDPDDIFSDSD